MPDDGIIKFQCGHCSQPIEAPAEMLGTEIECPGCGKTITVSPSQSQTSPSGANDRRSNSPLRGCLISILVILAGWICLSQWAEHHIRRNIEEHPEKYGATALRDRYEKEAETGLLKQCSNYLGFVRILNHSIFLGYITNGTGDATIDYVNKVGGVERTNLLFRFVIYDYHCMAEIDDLAMYERDIAKIGGASRK